MKNDGEKNSVSRQWPAIDVRPYERDKNRHNLSISRQLVPLARALKSLCVFAGSTSPFSRGNMRVGAAKNPLYLGRVLVAGVGESSIILLTRPRILGPSTRPGYVLRLR